MFAWITRKRLGQEELHGNKNSSSFSVRDVIDKIAQHDLIRSKTFGSGRNTLGPELCPETLFVECSLRLISLYLL